MPLLQYPEKATQGVVDDVHQKGQLRCLLVTGDGDGGRQPTGSRKSVTDM